MHTMTEPSINGKANHRLEKPERLNLHSLWDTVADLHKDLHGAKLPHHTTDRFRFWVTIALGCAIPLLSLTLSTIAGTLARNGHWTLAAFAAVCGVSVLVVSLSHLADAVADLTGATRWQSWLLSITLDLSLVLGELVHVFAEDAGLWMWTLALMTAVAAFSMLLNCHAFLSHRSGKGGQS
jgi:hypothetical protein